MNFTEGCRRRIIRAVATRVNRGVNAFNGHMAFDFLVLALVAGGPMTG
jgi:hypothetical protein